jgi:hypothetical protein
MSKEDWNNFTDQVNSNIIQHQTLTAINTAESLEKTWHKIHTSIINAAFQHIPNKKYTVRNFHHTFTPKATQLHYDLKTIDHIMHHTKKYFSHQTPLPTNIHNLINYINNTHNFTIEPPPNYQSNLTKWIQHTKTF